MYGPNDIAIKNAEREAQLLKLKMDNEYPVISDELPELTPDYDPSEPITLGQWLKRLLGWE